MWVWDSSNPHFMRFFYFETFLFIYLLKISKKKKSKINFFEKISQTSMYTLGVNLEFLSINTVFGVNYTFLDEEPTELPPEFIVFLDLFVFYYFSIPL